MISFFDYNYTLEISLLLLILFFLFAFISAVFILYIYFRQEPEIKATSVTVSLSMFLGSYMMISYLPVLVFLKDTIGCYLLSWLSLAGIPFTLILATLFVKMLRVYFIFSDPFSFKKIFFSDPLLFLYILLLISPGLLILIIWSSSDPFTFYSDRLGGLCVSAHTITWLVALLVYIFILSFAVACLAIKSSKIRYKHFQDTKATNAFTFLSCFVSLLTLIHWYFFLSQASSMDSVFISEGVLYIGHSGVAVLCQALLFVPKMYQPLRRRFTQSRVKSK